MLVRDAMTRNVPTIRVDKKLAAARSIMDWAGLNLLPVVDREGHMVGIVTRDSMRDAIPAEVSLPAERDRRLANTPVGNAIIPDAPTVTADTRAWQAAQVMTTRRVTCLPVVENDRVTGLVSASDLVALAHRVGDRLDFDAPILPPVA